MQVESIRAFWQVAQLKDEIGGRHAVGLDAVAGANRLDDVGDAEATVFVRVLGPEHRPIRGVA